MRKRILVGLVGAGLVGALGAEGCGGKAATGTTSGTGGTGTASSAHASSGAIVAASSASGTGGAGMGHTFDTANPIDFGTAASGDLSPTGAVDYYTFSGTAGQAVAMFTQAQGTTAAFSPTWIDTVITLYDGNKKQIAENNDAIPRRSGDSEIFTILPADGIYYVRVEECWTWASNPSSSCAGKAAKDNTAYSLSIVKIDPATKGNIKDKETGNDAASATALTYAKTTTTGYYLSVIYGTFKDASDVDVFSFTVPSDAVTVPAGERAVVSFWPLPAGTSDDGSSTPVGKMWVTDTLDTTKHLAEISGTDYVTQGTGRMWPALDLTKPYLLWVEHPATAAGAEDFYFVLNGQGSSNPVETNEAANDAVSTPEMPADAPDMNGGHHYYIDGDLIKNATDVDHWQVPVGTTTQIAVSCAAQRGGSGVRGFTIDVFDPAGVPSDAGPVNKVGTVTESATMDAFLSYTAIPAGVSKLVVKLSAMSQDPVVTGTFYHCGIHLK